MCSDVWNWNKRVLKLFDTYFRDIEHVGKYSWTPISLKNSFEIGPNVRQIFTHWDKIISAHEGWNNFEIILFQMYDILHL